MLNLFYEEPDLDRWMPFDRYPRRLIRNAVRGKLRPGGQMRVLLNLCAGLERVGVTYRLNNFKYLQANPEELACIIGKPHLLDKVTWNNPILFGAAVFSHPIDDPRLFNRRPVVKILVPGPWTKVMFAGAWDNKVETWPVGIDTDLWSPADLERKTIDVLLYDKVRWNRDKYETALIEPIRATLRKHGHSFQEIRYGAYFEEDFHSALQRCRTMIFLCEHETQGIAYQQALSCNVPIFAWDRGGYWQDPFYFPHRVKFAPVTSVPYWNDCCGRRFVDAAEFVVGWQAFFEAADERLFRPRDYIVENLTLEKCARNYVAIAEGLSHHHSFEKPQL
jgi:hypothetical protein